MYALLRAIIPSSNSDDFDELIEEVYQRVLCVIREIIDSNFTISMADCFTPCACAPGNYIGPPFAHSKHLMWKYRKRTQTASNSYTVPVAK